MSEELSELSQSIVEIAKEVDGHVANYGKNTPNDDTAAVWLLDWPSTGY